MKIPTALSLFLLNAHCLIAFEADNTWNGGNMALNASWSGSTPDANQNVEFRGTTEAGEPLLANSGFTEFKDAIWTTTREYDVTATGGVGLGIRLISGRNLTFTEGAAVTTFRNRSSDDHSNLLFTLTENLIVNSTVNFGTLELSNSYASIWGVDIGGTTVINSGGSISLTRLFTRGSTYPDGTFSFGAVEMNGGVFNLLAGGTNTGSINGTVNTVFVSSISGESGTVTSAKDAASTNTIAATLVVNGSTNSVYGGAITAGTGINATIGLTRTGTGSLELTGVNTYTGDTLISGGNLILSGSGSINNTAEIRITDDGALIHNSAMALLAPIVWEGGTIGGNGTITGNVAATGSGAKFLSPGNSTGILEFDGDLTLDSLTTVIMQLNGPAQGTGYDAVAVGGVLTLNDAVLSLSLGYTPTLLDSFEIATFSSLDGTFDGLGQGDTISVNGFSFQIDYADEAIILTTTAIPEPHTLASLFGLAALLAAVLRRSRGRLCGGEPREASTICRE